MFCASIQSSRCSHSSIRESAYRLMDVISVEFPDQMFQMIGLYFPITKSERFCLYAEQSSLFTSMLFDPCPPVQCAALRLVQTIFENIPTKQWFLDRQERSASQTFQTLGDKFKSILEVSHDAISVMVLREANSALISGTLKVRHCSSSRSFFEVAVDRISTCSNMSLRCREI